MIKYLIIFIVLFLVFIFLNFNNKENLIIQENIGLTRNSINDNKIDITESVIKNDIFFENFSKNFILEETGKIEKSENADWWVNSGAFLYSEDGIGRTIFGPLEKGSKWQIRFSKGKNDIPNETDGGYYPQNIFRLVTKSKWENFSQEVYYRIKKYNLSKDKHRKESNGLLLFNRYQNGFNLYYTGIRVDGKVIIKKKYKTKYYTLAEKKIFYGEYDRGKNPNLLAVNKWVGVRSEVETIDNNQVEIKVFVDKENNKN